MDFSSTWIKPICRFLIHRYMGEFLDTEIKSDQLELKLTEGTASVEDVQLNADYINGLLQDVGLVKFVQGFVSEIKIRIPWKDLLKDSTTIVVKGLALTFTPEQGINEFNTQELVTSMMGSIVSSMSRSVEDIIQEDMESEASVAHFATIIDQFITRIKVIFEDTTIRLDTESELATGLEMRISRMEFIDEVLEADEQTHQNEPVTSQPSSLYVATELNKLLHIEGIRLYTDVYSSDRSSSLNSSRHELSLDSHRGMDASDFKSCYSNLPAESMYQSVCPNQKNISFASSTTNTTHITSDPIPFLMVCGERSTVRIRVNNQALKASEGAFNKKVDIDFQLNGNSFSFLTASQLALLTDLFSKLTPTPPAPQPAHLTGGKPMLPEHFDKLNAQLQDDAIVDQIIRDSHNPSAPLYFSNALSHAAEQQFYEINNTKGIPNRFSNVSLNDEVNPKRHGSGSQLYGTSHTNSSGGDSDSFAERATHHGSNLTLVDKRPSVFAFTFRVPSLVCVISHDDPLSAENVRKLRQTDSEAIHKQIQNLKDRAETFFSTAIDPSPLELIGSPLDQQRDRFTVLYPEDHLKLLCRNAIFKFTNEVDEVRGGSGLFDIQCSFGNADVSEYLTKSSVVGAKNNVHVDLLNFARFELSESTQRGHGSTFSESNLSLRITNLIDSKESVTSIEATMTTCLTDFDVSIVDRLSALLSRTPFYYDKQLLLSEDEVLPQSTIPEMFTNSALKENFFFDQDNKERKQYQFRFYCPKWEVDLRIPIADYTPQAPSYNKRYLHEEYLKLQLEDARLDIPKFDFENLVSNFIINLNCSAIQGSFVGDCNRLNCSLEDMTFFYATGFNSAEGAFKTQNVHIQIGFDSRNKSLSLNNKPVGEFMAKSMSESFFQVRNEDKPQGPFTKDGNYFMGTRLVQPGRREELKEFADQAKLLSKLNIELNLPHLNLHLPSHEFLEVFYNRFANDFALFEPKSPPFKQQDEKPRLRSQQFKECGNFTDFGASNGSSKFNESIDESAGFKGNLFSLTLTVQKTKLLLQNIVQNDTEKKLDQFSVQLGLELSDAQYFLVHGFDQTPTLDYMFLTSNKSYVYHRNLLGGVKPMNRNVIESTFCTRRSADTHIEPISHNEPIDGNGDDSLAVAIKIHGIVQENLRDIVVAFAIRNSVFHVRPTVDPKHHFTQQFTDFFNLHDYGVPGFEWPKVAMGLHLNLCNTVLSYDHSLVVPSSKMVIKLTIGSCNLSASFLEQSEAHRFDCLLENSHLYLLKRKGTSSKQIFFNDQRKKDQSLNYIKFARVGLLHLGVEYQPGNEVEANAQPQLSVSLTDDDFTVWACADTITEFINTITDFVESDIGKAFSVSSEPPPPPDVVNEVILEPSLSTPPQLSNLLPHNPNSYPTMPSHKRLSTCSLTTQSSQNTQFSTVSKITPIQQEKIMEMMSDAMEDGVLTPSASTTSLDRIPAPLPLAPLKDPILEEIHSTNQTAAGDWSQATFEDENEEYKPESPGFVKPERSFEPNQSKGSDDEFVMIDEIVGSGITNAAGDPKVRVLDHSFEIIEDFLPVPDPDDLDQMVRLPPNNPPPIIKYEVKDFSIQLFLFGGNDFDTHPSPTKTYSMWDTRREDANRNGSQGGPFRDHTVCVEARINKISFISQVFNKDSPVLSLNMITVGDFEIRDHVLISDINKMFYQYVSASMPRRIAPMLSVRMVEDQAREGKLKISLLPLRLNIDQDTLEFLVDFSNSLSKDIRHVSPVPHPDDYKMDMPVMEVGQSLQAQEGVRRKSSTESIESRLTDFKPSSSSAGLMSMQDEFSVRYTKNSETEKNLVDFDDPVEPTRYNKPLASDLDDLFSTQMTFNDRGQHQTANLSSRSKYDSQSSNLSYQPQPTTLIEADLIGGLHQPMFGLGDPSVCDTEATQATTATKVVVHTRDTFFREFTFEPACQIRLDYVGKRIKTEEGVLQGLLIGLTNLKCTELELKEIRNDRGILGFNKCIQSAIDIWIADIKGGQLPNLVGSYKPITSLVEIGQGIRDLFYIPLTEMRKEDGRLVRGIQKGATSFGISTATAAIDATQQVFSVIQGVAELAFDLVTPDLPYNDHRRLHQQQLALRGNQIPSDIRAGLHLAYDTVSYGVAETAYELSQAAKDDRQRIRKNSGQNNDAPHHWWGFRGLLRQMTPTAIRPIVIGSQATIQVLAGMKNQLRPDDHQEEMDKWRQKRDSRHGSERRKK